MLPGVATDVALGYIARVRLVILMTSTSEYMMFAVSEATRTSTCTVSGRTATCTSSMRAGEYAWIDRSCCRLIKASRFDRRRR